MPPVVPNESGRLPEVSAAPVGQAREAEVRWRPPGMPVAC